MEIVLDLENKDRRPVNVEISWNIDITKSYAEKAGCNIFRRLFSKNPVIEKEVSVDILVKNEEELREKLVFDSVKDLFFISYNSETGQKVCNQNELPLKLNLKSMSTPFSLFFYQQNIKDCKIIQSEEDTKCNIDFEIILRDANDRDIDKVKGEVKLIFKKVENRPELKIIPNKKNVPIAYKSGSGKIHVGDLKVKLPNDLVFAPTVDLQVVLQMVDKNNKPQQGLLELTKDDVTIEFVDEKGLRTIINDQNGRVSATQSYKIFMDLDKVTNPMEDKDNYVIKANAKYKYSYDKTYLPFQELESSIDVLKDKQGTELVVEIYRDNELVPEESSNWKVPNIDFTASVLTFPVKVLLKNKATDTSRKNAGLIISNFNVNSVLEPDYSISDMKFNAVGANRVVVVKGNDPEMESKSGLFVPNGENAETSFSLIFEPESIYTIRRQGKKVYDFSITTTIDFDYVEDSLGDRQSAVKHFKGVLVWNLVKKPNPEWLCIDYGSSAIVCSYGKGSNNRILDLKTTRKKVYEDSRLSKDNTNGWNNLDKSDSIEQDTLFLSSDVLFNDIRMSEKLVTSLCSQLSTDDDIKYNNMAVILSPVEKLSAENFRRQLPCLKVLMGNEYLPEKEDFKNFRYNYIVNGEVRTDKAEDIRDTEYSLLKINNLYKETYHTLFHYFIQDETIVEQANKVVLTYPNTYTPRNLAILKEVVTKTLPEIREVEFVSESDAVAAYYMSHWDDYHKDGDIKADENILVYDMGAGTLDVTYLTKRYDQNSQRFELEICGKLGTGRAGNYLDYVIAKILSELPDLTKKGFKKSWVSLDMKAVENEVLTARVKLKSVIKNIIKPNLSKSGTIKFEINEKEFEFDPSCILEHHFFKEFLNQVSTDIWDNIRKYVGEDTYKVDTVIMSGRSMRLKQLQERVLKLAKEDDAECIMLDNVVNGPQAGKSTDRSKTAVVEGAKIFVETYKSEDSPVKIRSRRLQASYGVAFKRTGGKWDYREILSRHDIPFIDQNKRDFSRPSGPVEVEHVNESDVLRFIQTYLSEEDTINSLNEQKEEFISVMSEIMMSDFDNKASLKLDVMVDRNNSVSLYADGMETKYKAPAGVDLHNDITSCSLWPVSIKND